jgi:superfamily II DNA or RNA helicase
MTLDTQLSPGMRLYDRFLGSARLVAGVERYPAVVFITFKHPQTGQLAREPFGLADLAERFEIIESSAAFRADPEIVSLTAEAYRIQHAYLFNPLFATETSLIDIVPHQLAAVYGVPAAQGVPERLGILDMTRIRFLLADDAGAGKTIMAALLIRELLLRRAVQRVLIVPPAGLVGNWRRELDVLFNLRFRELAGSDFADHENPFADPRNRLAIISIDTLWRDRAREAYLAAAPYDLVIFDEAHKLSAGYLADLTIDKTNRYAMAELIARQNRHLLLMTATPHMGKQDRYYMLWRLLEPELFSTQQAFDRLTRADRQHYLLRRMKEEMVTFDARPLYVERTSETASYPLRAGEGQERDLYNRVTEYCDVHFDRAKQRNRSSAGLAMSILQRRLASSTWALWKSVERRAQKLRDEIQEIDSGALDLDEFRTLQGLLPATSSRDTATGDEEEAQDGLEQNEVEDRAVEGATDALTLAELRIELSEVEGLVELARRVYDRQKTGIPESKFEQLWDTLTRYPETKILIFTEFRDTLDYLVDRLQGRGLTGKIAAIHGGMTYQERDRQAAFFRKDARIMVATDAAGEGINLQFCWLLINYDIPWNPARLEQRMGRVHRYKQEHPVLLINVLAQDTREGRVLKVLLEKLENIRRDLGSDKVFDIVGQQFTSKPLAQLIFEAVVEGREEETTGIIEHELTNDNARRMLDELERRVEASEVRSLLAALQQRRELAETHRMMPAYVRRFVQLAAERVGAGIHGDIDAMFAFTPCPPSIQQALSRYPEAIRQRLTVDRELAKPDLTREPTAIYLHPGEAVFDALADLYLAQHDGEGTHGALFYDAETEAPYLFSLARLLVVRDVPGADEPETVHELMTGLRRFADGRFDLAPAHLLLTLYPHTRADAWPAFDDGWVAAASGTGPVEAYFVAEVGMPELLQRRQAENARIPQRVAQLTAAYNLRRVELSKQRRILKEAVGKGVPAAASKLRACEGELTELDANLRRAEADLRTAPDRLRLGQVQFYAQALVLPMSPAQTAERIDLHAEQIALQEVMRREQAEGSTWEDVSAPHLKSGFDLKVRRVDGTLRYVEVKGRRGTNAIELTENEWAQAANHPDRYWLYVVFHCDTTPTLHRVANPFSELVARPLGSMRIQAAEIIRAAERQPPSPRA